MMRHLKQLHCQLYSRDQVDNENLPTLVALHENFKGTHYMAMTFTRNFRGIQNFQSPEGFDWKYNSINKLYKLEQETNSFILILRVKKICCTISGLPILKTWTF